MAEMTDIAGSATKLRDYKIVGLIGTAHFMSHVYVMMLPPLFMFVRGDDSVSFAQLGIAIAVFGFFSATLQTPAGFVVDRLGSSTLLIAGLVVSGTGCAIVGLLPGYGALILGYALLGLANTIYHPADYCDHVARHLDPSAWRKPIRSTPSSAWPAKPRLPLSCWGWRASTAGTADS